MTCPIPADWHMTRDVKHPAQMACWQHGRTLAYLVQLYFEDDEIPGEGVYVYQLHFRGLRMLLPMVGIPEVFARAERKIEALTRPAKFAMENRL